MSAVPVPTARPCEICRDDVDPRAVHICDDCGRETCPSCVGLWTGGDDGVCTACVDALEPEHAEGSAL